MTNQERLALEFAAVLRTWLSPAQMAEVIRRNREQYTEVMLDGTHCCCASHDFCDANMAMLEAVHNLGLEDFTNYEGECLERDAALELVNNAWELARQADFYFDRRCLENVD